MRLVFFLPQLCEGGAQQVAVLLANYLSKEGVDITLALASMRGELMDRIEPQCKIVDLSTSKPIRATKSLSALVKKEKPTAIICFGIYTGIAATISKSIFRWEAPILIRNENNLERDWNQGTPLNRLIGPSLSRWAAKHGHIIAVSHSLSRATSSYLHIHKSKVTTILNPVIEESSDFKPRENSELHPWLSCKENRTFIAMGRLENQKGFDILIDAFSMIPQSTGARLLIFGEGSLRASLQKKIESCGMQDSILLAGHTNSGQTQMRAAHAFVLSSRFEGFGLVLVEAMHAKTRIISTNCDFGPAELLENGRYGTLVPTDNANALADAMIASLTNQQTTSRPDSEWFRQFTAAEAAHQHLKLIKSLQLGNH